MPPLGLYIRVFPSPLPVVLPLLPAFSGLRNGIPSYRPSPVRPLCRTPSPTPLRGTASGIARGVGHWRFSRYRHPCRYSPHVARVEGELGGELHAGAEAERVPVQPRVEQLRHGGIDGLLSVASGRYAG